MGYFDQVATQDARKANSCNTSATVLLALFYPVRRMTDTVSCRLYLPAWPILFRQPGRCSRPSGDRSERKL